MLMSKAFRLGVFVVAMLLIFAAGVFWIGSKQFLFTSTYRLNAEFTNVAGLNGGAEVRVGGIHEGSVIQIQLPQKSNEKVRVVMALARGTRDVVKKDSVATIRSEGLVGDKFVELSFGSDQSPKVSNGDTIQSLPPLQLSDLMQKTSEILDSAQGAVTNVDQTANNLNSISSKINQGTGTLGSLVNDRKVYQNVNAGANAFQENMEALKHNFFVRGYFNKRGYDNSAELGKHDIPQLPPDPVAKRFTYDAKELFDKPDTAKLKKSNVLKDAGAYLEGNSFGVAVVASYTDMKGDTDKDRVLTEARAMVVRDYLVQNFKLDDTRMKTIGLGKSKDVSDGGRVEVLVYPAGTNIAQTSQPSPKP
jgi:phospholipid/cholesterol/gamma-HCH transport system substrate-binding protein